MANPFVAEIRIFPFNFAPRGWAFCNGQLLPISQNTALFSLLGTTYGGDGRSNFALPNLQGANALHTTQYSGGNLFGNFSEGQTGGSSAVTLVVQEMPVHTHAPLATTSATTNNPAGAALANTASGASAYHSAGATVAMAQASLAVQGISQPHNNLSPYLALNFCIAMQGVFPPRS